MRTAILIAVMAAMTGCAKGDDASMAPAISIELTGHVEPGRSCPTNTLVVSGGGSVLVSNTCPQSGMSESSPSNTLVVSEPMEENE